MDKLEIIKTEANELLKKMIDTFEVEVVQDGEMYQLIIKTEADAPTVIGRHGETIRAIQKILEVMLFKKVGEPVDLLVNVNDYREKQKERLEGIAENIAQRVKTEKREVPLKSFSSYERRIVHEFLASKPNIATESTGEGRLRRVVIKYVD